MSVSRSEADALLYHSWKPRHLQVLRFPHSPVRYVQSVVSTTNIRKLGYAAEGHAAKGVGMRLKLSVMGGLKKGSGGVRLWRYRHCQHNNTMEARAETDFNVYVGVQVLTLFTLSNSFFNRDTTAEDILPLSPDSQRVQR